ncbi:MAG TPA: tRNA (5-methylaminomethyl-2-thiouridine)(34)-methyltransferase MnmD [Phaeodactylibacter sp.]|nr:tRNA (5-methylaminomethyl-2-thiouridine)(34)-methyltransferase MnmD [Phaeodactylibacter sp.]
MEEQVIFTTQDGSHSIQSDRYGVSYHSKYGAIQESRHVFLSAGLFPKLIGQEEARVLEIGLGTGLNALLTRLEADQRQQAIHYTALEAFPITLQQARQLNYPQILGVEQDTFLELHACEWAWEQTLSNHFQFTKLQQRFENLDFDAVFDVVYFDAFAPTAQPELWEPVVLEKVVRAMAPGGIFVTYCAKGAVKRALKTLGLEVEALQGPPGKREMTRARKLEH